MSVFQAIPILLALLETVSASDKKGGGTFMWRQ